MPSVAEESCELALELTTMRELLQDYCPCEKQSEPSSWRKLLRGLAQHGQTPSPSCHHTCIWCNRLIKASRHGPHTEDRCPQRPSQ